jgi:TetR/AcrR family transcriptional repressor of uid operon
MTDQSVSRSFAFPPRPAARTGDVPVPRLAEEARSERRQQLIDAGWRCASTQAFRSLTVDDVCAEAGVSKGAFYLYFDQKQDLLLALLEDDAAGVDATMEDLSRSRLSGVERLRQLVRAELERAEDAARLQLRADLWAEMSSNPEVRERFAEVVRRRRMALRSWIDEAITAGELIDLPSNALAAILLALGDGLMLHAGLDPSGFRWTNVRRALDAVLEGIEDE